MFICLATVFLVGFISSPINRLIHCTLPESPALVSSAHRPSSSQQDAGFSVDIHLTLVFPFYVSALTRAALRGLQRAQYCTA